MKKRKKYIHVHTVRETYRDKILTYICVKGMEQNVKVKQNPVWQFLIMYKIPDIAVVECPNLIPNPQNLKITILLNKSCQEYLQIRIKNLREAPKI
jgi:hypothetical protein